MAQHTTTNSCEGIILRTFSHGENNLILKVLTPDLGKISLYARHAKNSKHRFAANPETFDYGTFLMTPSRGGGMYNLSSFRPTKIYRNLRVDFNKLGASSLLCESFDNLTLEGHEDNVDAREMFEALCLGMESVDHATSEIEICRSCFLTLSGLLRISGLLDQSNQVPATRNNLLKIIDKVEIACEKRLLSRSAFEQILSDLPAKVENA